MHICVCVCVWGGLSVDFSWLTDWHWLITAHKIFPYYQQLSPVTVINSTICKFKLLIYHGCVLSRWGWYGWGSSSIRSEAQPSAKWWQLVGKSILEWARRQKTGTFSASHFWNYVLWCDAVFLSLKPKCSHALDTTKFHVFNTSD